MLDVVAAGLNRADVQQRKGFYPPPPTVPAWRRIAGFGPGVTKPFRGGQGCRPAGRWRLRRKSGGARQDSRRRGPRAAASLPEVAATVYSNLVMVAGPVAGGGDRADPWGPPAVSAPWQSSSPRPSARTWPPQRAPRRGSGGTAKAFLGADIAINTRRRASRRACAPRNGGKADVILDVVGAKYLGQNVDALADYGRLRRYCQGGTKAELDLDMLVSGSALPFTTSLRPRPVEEKTVIMNAVRGHAVWPLVADGRIPSGRQDVPA